MAKASAKNSILLVNGYALSTYALNYDGVSDAGKIDVTGFTDGCTNFIPGLKTDTITAEMYWDYGTDGGTWEALKTIGATGEVSILPEGATTGNKALSMQFTQANFNPRGSPSEAIKIGTIQFDNSGSGTGLEYGEVLYSGTTTATYCSTGVLDVSAAAATATCGAVLHITTASTADTYAIKVQDSADSTNGIDGTWADLVTFTLNGSALGAQRVVVASGTVDKYRKVVATRTGAAGTTLGFTVIFWRANN